MSLSEKAKTFGQIKKQLQQLEANGHQDPRAISERYNLFRVKWVRLEDHQQEIDKENEIYHVLWEKYANLNELFQSLMSLACDYYDDTERERGEQKQKLQQMLKLWDNQGHLGIVLQETDWLLGEFGQLRKLELLKK